jgi:broad specificity phosphatase PhoE
MADLLLIRHAEPALRGVFLGRTDPPLSARGREQAAALDVPEHFRVYCSPLRRAVETAEFLQRPVTVLPGLAEIDYGPWDGLSWAQIEASYPEHAARKLEDWLGYCVPGAEAWSVFAARVLADLPQGGDFAIIAHLGVNSVIHQSIRGESPLHFQQEYCQVMRYAL